MIKEQHQIEHALDLFILQTISQAIYYDTNSRRKRDIDRALAKMIAKDVQPFNIVENKGSSKKSYP